MTLAEFIKKYTNSLWDFDGVYGAQCADLVNFYARDVVGAPPFQGISAKDFYGEHPDYYEWILNGQTNYPNAGDIIVWDNRMGNGDGHTAIALEPLGTYRLTSLDQNWGPQVTHIVNHPSYYGVIGWGRPKGKKMDQQEHDWLASIVTALGLGAVDPAKWPVIPPGYSIPKVLADMDARVKRIEDAMKGA